MDLPENLGMIIDDPRQRLHNPLPYTVPTWLLLLVQYVLLYQRVEPTTAPIDNLHDGYSFVVDNLDHRTTPWLRRRAMRWRQCLLSGVQKLRSPAAEISTETVTGPLLANVKFFNAVSEVAVLLDRLKV